jgi:REP element-mobilizing transposase RayT
MCIFTDDCDYRQFINMMSDVVEEFDIRCWNYCLMPNHYHGTWQPTLPNVSEAMRVLNGNYGQWWNRRHGRVGHVFQGRFKDQIVDRESYLLNLSRYVVMNPVRAGLTKHPGDWPWSSYRATAGLSSPPAFLAVDATLGLFGDGDESILRARFIDAVTNRVVDRAADDRIRSNERILGPKAFKDAVRAARIAAKGPGCVALPEPLERVEVNSLEPASP